MTKLFTNLSKNVLSLVVGPRMDREWTGIRPMRFIAILAMMLCFGVGEMWGTTITLKVWDHSQTKYVDYGTFESGTKPGQDPMLYDGIYTYYSVIAWAPGEQVEDIVHPGNSGSDYYGNYAWPNANYSGAATTLYAVYNCTSDYAHDGSTYYTTKPNVPWMASCEDLADASSLAVNTSFSSGGNTYVKFTWTLGTGTSTNATYQKICYGLDGSAGTCVSTLDKSATSKQDILRSSLSNGKYWWSIQALGDGDDYCDGNAVDGPAFCIDAIGSATPSGISATPTSATTATITWDAVSDAAYYDIEVKNNSTNAVVCSDETDETSFNATSLVANTEYRVELKAFNACDEGSVKSTSYTFTIVQYTVHWYVNGETWEGSSHGSPATTVLSGARPSPLPTAPTSDDFCGSAFMGWTDHEITGSSGQPSPLFKSLAPVATGNVNFYAVFADEQP